MRPRPLGLQSDSSTLPTRLKRATVDFGPVPRRRRRRHVGARTLPARISFSRPGHAARAASPAQRPRPALMRPAQSAGAGAVARRPPSISPPIRRRLPRSDISDDAVGTPMDPCEAESKQGRMLRRSVQEELITRLQWHRPTVTASFGGAGCSAPPWPPHPTQHQHILLPSLNL